MVGLPFTGLKFHVLNLFEVQGVEGLIQIDICQKNHPVLDLQHKSNFWLVISMKLGRSIRFLKTSQELGNAKVLMPEKTIPWGVTHFLGALAVFLFYSQSSWELLV